MQAPNPNNLNAAHADSSHPFNHAGVSENWGILSRGPYNKDPTFFQGTIVYYRVRVPYFRKLPCVHRTARAFRTESRALQQRSECNSNPYNFLSHRECLGGGGGGGKGGE